MIHVFSQISESCDGGVSRLAILTRSITLGLVISKSVIGVASSVGIVHVLSATVGRPKNLLLHEGLLLLSLGLCLCRCLGLSLGECLLLELLELKLALHGSYLHGLLQLGLLQKLLLHEGLLDHGSVGQCLRLHRVCNKSLLLRCIALELTQLE